MGAESVSPAASNLQNLKGQNLLFRCLETGFVTTAPALTRYQRARSIDSARRELVGERPGNWVKAVPSTTCEHCEMEVKGNQWAFRQHQQSKRCLKAQTAAPSPATKVVQHQKTPLAHDTSTSAVATKD